MRMYVAGPETGVSWPGGPLPHGACVMSGRHPRLLERQRWERQRWGAWNVRQKVKSLPGSKSKRHKDQAG